MTLHSYHVSKLTLALALFILLSLPGASMAIYSLSH